MHLHLLYDNLVSSHNRSSRRISSEDEAPLTRQSPGLDTP